ncbi:actin binding protein family protein [Entamoeba histolytica HM-1:IMSS-B]|uniref:Coactosin n=6 Tax=Entamoeba histolytica TaxID=5759 RepID=COAA_ENTH1|nr:actin-binding protein, cofilin/tropomyosin family [Entamoeba histolytica HM-1:IMSS]C4M4P4.1 RecName: Full=Coactosin [Entamoeba histolytica HM-1:IMSS]EMD49471.1 actinbinding protein cofilin/tropomyosin family protein [Entamoeba histolytica KU27]EMH77991.1 actin binding protein family protein [Entamoeba histolytica HM-1:IMSS-B]EMS12793.1 actin-binding protein, cofilin/tropomyosin family protein [Entamoeba histolytica HM-3:IMSS]ENY64124.1 actin-binding protein, cofilin/tropomyosin family prote|eukprot:XP_650926.1 actin-binding protein, cofilin/tropomyosin family [Entamoeba histolytica HM-1:IMSS]
MSGFDLSEVAGPVAEVIDDKNEEVEFVVFGVQTQPNKLVVDAKGKGGLEEVKAALKEDALQFAYYRTISGDEESKRVKFVFISWAGEGIKKPKLRAVMSILKGDVKNVINNFHIELHATSLDDLVEDEIAAKIKKAGGADYSFNTTSN